MLVENLAIVMRVQFTDEPVFHHAFLEFDIPLIEHVLQNIFKCPILVLKSLVIETVVRSTDNTLEETRIINTISDFHGVLDRSTHDVVHGLQDAEGFISGGSQLH